MRDKVQFTRPIKPITPRQSRNLARIVTDEVDFLVSLVDKCARPAEQLAVARFLQSLAGDLMFSVAKATQSGTVRQ